jgi:hypothetical protein
VNRNDTRLPSQLRVVGATDLERRLLDAGARELPSLELTRRMQQGLGLSLAVGASTAAGATTAKAATAAGAGSATPAVVWPAISFGVLALAVTGAVVVGVRSTANHTASHRTPAVIPVAAPAPLEAPPAAEPVASPAPVRVAHRVAIHHRAPAAATQSELRAEIALVDAARSAVGANANERALALLDRYEGTYPRGTFRPEVAALRIEALQHLGRVAQAHALARKFIATHADSPLADRVARVTGLEPR